ncbi:MAG TPA: hypothetical protein VFF70_07585 [Anaerolineae bacterium]|jgi:glycopeptide antibiotics resistance protein|nr:hypothetical protein [Anaerolineae bacterium]
MNTKRNDVVIIVNAIVVAVIIGWIDFHATEPQPAAFLLIIFGAIFGFLRPRSAWRWAIILGLSLFVTELIFPLFGLQPIDPPQPNVFATLFALIPAFIGTYAGVVARKITGSLSSDADR